ncbi:Sialidase [Frankliniella fusca]|uniref:Sialidase n=1 Tax=Frankliniella fusca TaxID=407009 RepID=A0AAE1HB17_9NEOP|nr:Sialidase [Frankliniella fusca]
MVCQAAGPSTSNSQQPDYTPAPQIQQQQPKHHVVEVNDAESQTENAMIVIAERIATALEKVASALGGQLPPAPAHAAPPAPAHAATPAPAHAAPSAPAHAAPSAPAHAAPSAPSHAAPPAPAHAAQAAQPLSGAAQAGEESQDTYDPYVPIDDSEDDVDPSTRCGVCRAGLGETPGDAKNIRKAATFALCEKIKKVSEYNYDIRRRVACGLDAVASDVMYHTYCLRREERKCEAGAGGTPKPLVNLAFDKICYELRVAADKSQVLRLSGVFQRCTTLCAGIGEQVPAQYLSRMSTFKCDLEKRLKDVFEFYHPMDRENSERETLLIPQKFSHTLTVKSAYGDHECTMPPYTPPENSNFNAIVHTALRLRSTLENVKGHIGANVEKSDALSLIPQDLHLFLSIMLGGTDGLQQIENQRDENDNAIKTDTVTSLKDFKILSLAQDIIFIAGGGRKLTPKHIGLGITLHKETRNKSLVQLFNRAGHCISYDQVLQFDTALAEKTLETVDTASGVVIPANLKQEPGRTSLALLHLTADNVDIQLDTLDGKKSFHGTQLVAFQRGARPLDEVLSSITLSRRKSVKIPEAIQTVAKTNVKLNTIEPKLQEVKEEWYETSEISESRQGAKVQDLTYLFHRQYSNDRQGWTAYTGVQN